MLAFPTKQSDDKKLDWSGDLQKYLSRAYSPQIAAEHKTQCESIAKHRARAMREGTPIEDKREACINYFRLLGALEMRFASSELRINFIWRDAFQKVVRMGEADMRYESAAILFNLAAETSLAGITQPRQEPEGLKSACHLFQQAAGIIDLLISHTANTSWAARSTVDLSPPVLRTIHTLMLAQAQRCYYERAVLDAMSPKLLSRIAAQLALFYDEVGASLRTAPLLNHMPNSWSTICAWNHKLFQGLAHSHLAAVHATEYQYGAQVTRLKTAAALLKEPCESSVKDAALHATYKYHYEKVNQACNQAEHDNNTIYCEREPTLNSLEQLAPRAIVNPAPPSHSLTQPALFSV